MSLWYDCGDGFARARLARQQMGQPVILCAPGPSMERVERQPGVMVAALTKAYPTIKPDIWFGLDTPECYDRRVWFEGFTKVARSGHQNMAVDGRPVRELPNVYFADCHEMKIEHIFRDRHHDAKFGWWFHTLGAALNILVWMGARTIYLNGFDLRSVEGKDYGPGVDKVLSDDLRAGNQRLFDSQVAWLKKFTHFANLNGITVASCTPNSPINEFMPYHSLAMALTMSQKRIPAPGKLFHSKELEAIQRRAAGSNLLPFSRDGVRAAIQRAQIQKAVRGQKPKKAMSAAKFAAELAHFSINSNPIVLPPLEISPTGRVLTASAA
jgi:hypothetical protein